MRSQTSVEILVFVGFVLMVLLILFVQGSRTLTEAPYVAQKASGSILAQLDDAFTQASRSMTDTQFIVPLTLDTSVRSVAFTNFTMNVSAVSGGSVGSHTQLIPFNVSGILPLDGYSSPQTVYVFMRKNASGIFVVNTSLNASGGLN